jgi:ABC-type transport system involved in multi-copper enzyme maturation permease subunit
MKFQALVKNSFREFIREKFVLISLFVAIFLFGFSQILGALSFDEKIRILAHFGYLAIYLSGMGIAIFLGSYTMHKEMEKQTCLLVLSRPVSRTQFLLSKFVAILALVTLIDFVLLLFLKLLLGSAFAEAKMLLVFMGIWLEQSILLSLALLGSVTLRSSIAVLASIGVVLIGHWVEEVAFFAKRTQDPLFLVVSKVAKTILPNLYQMNWRSVYFLEKGVSDDQIAWVLLHALGWVCFSLSLACYSFRRKDLV